MGTLTNYSTNQNGLTINVEPTRKNKLKNQVIADGRYLPFKTQTFNITISSDVLEHIAEQDRNKFLIELLRCTKKSTIITFSKIHTCNPNRNAIKIFQAFTHLPPDWYNEHNNKNIVENQKVTDTVEQNQKNTVSVTPIVGFWAVIFTGILQNVPWKANMRALSNLVSYLISRLIDRAPYYGFGVLATKKTIEEPK